MRKGRREDPGMGMERPFWRLLSCLLLDLPSAPSLSLQAQTQKCWPCSWRLQQSFSTWCRLLRFYKDSENKTKQNQGRARGDSRRITCTSSQVRGLGRQLTSTGYLLTGRYIILLMVPSSKMYAQFSRKITALPPPFNTGVLSVPRPPHPASPAITPNHSHKYRLT